MKNGANPKSQMSRTIENSEMKTKLAFIILLAVVSLTLKSCEKLDVCATCIEATTSYNPGDFCSTEKAVDAYIRELESTASQDWHCTKN